MTEKVYYKILACDWVHHGFQYKEGLNVDTVPFNPTGLCTPGGLYFTEKENIFDFLEYGCFIVEVRLPVDARVYKDNNKYKADKIIISNPQFLSDYVQTLSRLKKLDLRLKYPSKRFCLLWLLTVAL